MDVNNLKQKNKELIKEIKLLKRENKTMKNRLDNLARNLRMLVLNCEREAKTKKDS